MTITLYPVYQHQHQVLHTLVKTFFTGVIRKVLELNTVTNGISYTLSFKSPRALYDSDFPIAKKIIDSFQIIGP